MLNALVKIALLCVLTVVGLLGLHVYRGQTAQTARIADLESQTAQQKEQIDQQHDVIDRLSVEQRVADLIVSGQSRATDGKLHTTLLMVEYARDGRALPPRSVEVMGEQVHLDALVIKFDAASVQRNDPLRGRALLLFEKIYGDAQAPADATRLDKPGSAPSVYRDAEDPKLGAFERSLWQQFWELAGDAQLRERAGVKVVHGAGVFAPMHPGVRYGVTLAANGNVTLYDEPLPPLLKGLLDARPQQPTVAAPGGK